MSRIIRPPSWGFCSSSLTVPSATPGVSLTPGASNVEGTPVAVLGALTHDVEYIVVQVGGFNASGVDHNVLVDILIDPAGGTAWASFIDDLIASHSAAIPYGKRYFLPVWLKAGTAIGAQARGNSATPVAGRVQVAAFGGNRNPGSWWAGTKVTTVGATPASSEGTAHTAATTPSFSAWASLGSPLTQAVGAWQVGIGGSDATAIAQGYLWQIGIGSTQIGPSIHCTQEANETTMLLNPGPIYAGIASGSQLQVRATASGAAETVDVAFYGVS